MLADGSEYRGDYDPGPAALADFHRPRLDALVAAGVDILAIETIPTVREAEVLIGLLDEVGVPAWLSYSCRDGRSTSAGEPIEDAVALGTHPRGHRRRRQLHGSPLPSGTSLRGERGDRPAPDRLSERGRSLGCRVQAVGRRSAGRLRSHRRRLLDRSRRPMARWLLRHRAGRDRAPGGRRGVVRRVSPVPSPPAPLRPGVPRRVPGDAPSAPPGSRLGRAPAAPTAGSR